MTILYYVVKIHIKSKPYRFLPDFLITTPAFLLTIIINTLYFSNIQIHTLLF